MVCKGIQDIRDKKPRPPLVPVSLVEMLDGNLRRIAASPCSTCLLPSWRDGQGLEVGLGLFYGQLWQQCRLTLPLLLALLQDLQANWGVHFSVFPNSQNCLLHQDAQPSISQKICPSEGAEHIFIFALFPCLPLNSPFKALKYRTSNC